MPTPKQAAKNRRQQRHANRMRAVIRRDIGAAMKRDNQRLAATWKAVHDHRAAHPDDDRDFDTIAAELKPQIEADALAGRNRTLETHRRDKARIKLQDQVNVDQLRRSWQAE